MVANRTTTPAFRLARYLSRRNSDGFDPGHGASFEHRLLLLRGRQPSPNGFGACESKSPPPLDSSQTTSRCCCCWRCSTCDRPNAKTPQKNPEEDMHTNKTDKQQLTIGFLWQTLILFHTRLFPRRRTNSIPNWLIALVETLGYLTFLALLVGNGLAIREDGGGDTFTLWQIMLITYDSAVWVALW